MQQGNLSNSRRGWLVRLLSGAIAVTGGVIAYPVVWYLRPRKAVNPSGEREVAAPYRVDQLVPNAEGKWPSPFNFDGKPCLLIKTPAGEIKAFNAICTHAQCTVEFRTDKGDLFCNCHNGVFDTNGRNVSGPPPRPLEEFQVSLRGQPGQEEIVVSRT
jgi:Rieske Fe-S protein